MSNSPSGVLAPALNDLVDNPDLALVCVLTGILLLYVEFNRPGKVIYAALGIFSATLGGYALLQHPMDPAAVAVFFLGIGFSVLGLHLRFGALLEALSMLTLTWALHNLILRGPGIDLSGAFIVSSAFVVSTTWLGGIAVQAHRNKRLPARSVQPTIPTQRPPQPHAR